VAWAAEHYAPRLVVSSSFGGPTSLVVVDMLHQMGKAVPVAYLDTGVLFPETYELVETVRKRYGIEPIAIRPDLTMEQQSAAHGDALWERDPDKCCEIRKVVPQTEFLRSYDAWVTGLRRDQSSTRSATPIAHWDGKFGLVKINPLARWSERDVWRYISEHKVPVNPLLSRGYTSIGCTYCTRRVGEGEGGRDGRWAGFNKTECGLHYQI